MNFKTECGQRHRFDSQCTMRLFFTWHINHLHVICFVPGHHLITSNTIENGMHDGPLGRGFAPAAFSFLPRQFNGPTDAKVAVQFPIHNKHPTHTQSDRAWKPL